MHNLLGKTGADSECSTVASGWDNHSSMFMESFFMGKRMYGRKASARLLLLPMVWASSMTEYDMYITGGNILVYINDKWQEK